jgi:hypothetical protein
MLGSAKFRLRQDHLLVAMLLCPLLVFAHLHVSVQMLKLYSTRGLCEPCKFSRVLFEAANNAEEDTGAVNMENETPLGENIGTYQARMNKMPKIIPISTAVDMRSWGSP